MYSFHRLVPRRLSVHASCPFRLDVTPCSCSNTLAPLPTSHEDEHTSRLAAVQIPAALPTPPSLLDAQLNRVHTYSQFGMLGRIVNTRRLNTPPPTPSPGEEKLLLDQWPHPSSIAGCSCAEVRFRFLSFRPALRATCVNVLLLSLDQTWLDSHQSPSGRDSRPRAVNSRPSSTLRTRGMGPGHSIHPRPECSKTVAPLTGSCHDEKFRRPTRTHLL